MTYVVHSERLQEFFLRSRGSCCDSASDGFGQLNGDDANTGAAAVDENALARLNLRDVEQDLISCKPDQSQTRCFSRL